MKLSLYGSAIVMAGLALSGAGMAQESAPAPSAATTVKTAKPINIDFKDMALRDALDALFRGTGMNYAVTNEAVQAAPTVTINLQDVTFDAALNIITRTNGLKYHKDRDTGVYMIEAKTVDTTATSISGTSPLDTTTATPDVAPTTQIEKIPINYADVVDIYTTLMGQGSNRANSSSGSGGFGGSSGGFGGSSGGFGGSSGFGSSGGFGGSSGFGSSGGFGGSSGFGSSGGFGGSSGGFGGGFGR